MRLRFFASFHLRILVPFLVLNLAVIGVFWVVSQTWITRTAEETHRVSLVQLLEKTATQVDSMLLEMSKAALYIGVNPGVRQVFEASAKAGGPIVDSPIDPRRRALMDVLVSWYTPRSSFTRISLFDDRGDYLSLGLPDQPQAIRDRLAGAGFQAWYKSLSVPQSFRFLAGHPDFWSDDPDRQFVSVIREIRAFDAPTASALVQVQQDLETFADLCRLDGLPQVLVYLTVEGRPVLSPSRPGAPRPAAVLEACPAGTQTDFPVSVPGSSYLAFGQDLGRPGWHLIFVEPELEYHQAATLAGILLLAVGLGLLVLSVLSVFLISDRVSRPLADLHRSVQSVSLENLAIDLSSTDTDEVLVLSKAFQAMFQRLKTSMDDAVALRSREMNAQLLAMQAQMNPHFLFNTLQVISSAGQENGAPTVVRLCARLSKILRYVGTFDSDLPTAAQELDHTATYLELMGDRFEASFSCSIDVDEGLETVRLPKLSIQPLVENCFEHGFKRCRPPWTVGIRFSRVNAQTWRLEVSDNGDGMDEAVRIRLLDRIRDHSQASDASLRTLLLDHIGLLNTFIRLRLLYGDQARMGIEPRDRGTLVWMTGGIGP